MKWRITAIVGVGLFAGWVGYELSDRSVPTIVYSKVAEPKAVRPGDHIRFIYTALRLRSCATHVDRLLFTADGKRHVIMPLEFVRGTLPIGTDNFTTEITVPMIASPGEAIYRTVNSYECNWTQSIWPIVDAPRDIVFEIVN